MTVNHDVVSSSLTGAAIKHPEAFASGCFWFVLRSLRQKGGYCPCRFERTEDTKCICREFREQMADPDFEGYCHCRLYYKSKD